MAPSRAIAIAEPRTSRLLSPISAKRHIGPPPYGFQWEDGKLIVHPDEAPVRQLAFELFLEHRRKGTVARVLNERDHPPRQGAEWRDMTVGRMLKCPSAKGLYLVNKTRKDETGRRVPRPESEWQAIECETIVSEEIWNEVNAILEEQANKSKRPGRRGVHTFTGFTSCGICGGRMIVPASNAHKYVCSTPGCGTKISIIDLEAVFQDELAEFLQEREEALIEIFSGASTLAGKKRLLADHLRQIEKIESEVSKTQQLYFKDQISTERFGKIHQPLEERLTELRSEAGKTQKEVERLSKESPERDSEEKFDVQKLVENWPDLSVKDRRQIAQTLIDHLIIGDGEIEIAYRFAQTPISSQQTKKPQASYPSLKDATISQQTSAPTDTPSVIASDEPVYIRLPKPGQLCSRTGLSRAMMNELILPTRRNNYRPPVKSINLRKAENIRGTRLILWASLKIYLQAKEE